MPRSAKTAMETTATLTSNKGTRTGEPGSSPKIRKPEVMSMNSPTTALAVPILSATNPAAIAATGAIQYLLSPTAPPRTSPRPRTGFGRQGPTQDMRHLKPKRGRNSVLGQIFSPRPVTSSNVNHLYVVCRDAIRQKPPTKSSFAMSQRAAAPLLFLRNRYPP